VPLVAARTTGIGARAENATLPSAGAYSYERAVYDLKYLYGKTAVTGPSMAKSKSDAGSFLEVLRSELDGLRMDLQKDLARQVYGAGDGFIVQCGTTTSDNDIVLAADVGKEAIRKGQLYVGMLVDIGTTANVDSQVLARTITAVDYANGTITIDGAATNTSASHFVSRSGSAVDNGSSATGSRSNEVDGLARIVSTSATAFGEIDPTAKPFWDNKRIGSVGAIALDDLQQGLNLIRLEGGKPSVMVTSLGVQREIFNLLDQNVRYVDPESYNYVAGFQTIEYAGLPVIADIDAPYGRLYMLDEATIKVFSDQDWHFLDADGQTLRQVANMDAFEAVMARYMNLGVTKRNNHVVLSGITVDGGTDAGV
jgi:hypothetical protein